MISKEGRHTALASITTIGTIKVIPMVKNLTRVASPAIDWDVTGEARVAVDAPGLGAVLGAEIVICEIIAEDETAGVETDADSDAGE